MRTTLLILFATLLPLVWGWGVHRLMMKLWPQSRPKSLQPRANTQPAVPPIDYQI